MHSVKSEHLHSEKSLMRIEKRISLPTGYK